MPLRDLTAPELEGYEALRNCLGEVALIMPTETGLTKSIMDATISVRSFLKTEKIHDFSAQGQGQKEKLSIEASLVSREKLIPSNATLYRPETKKGDPRIWFSGLPRFAKSMDILAIFKSENGLAVINISDINVADILRTAPSSALSRLVKKLSKNANAVSDELLGKLRLIAKERVRAECVGDTAVGRTLESLLGIAQNSNKAPDYKGIELKSFRGKRGTASGGGTRGGLFGQVPNWKKSKLKSSAEVLKNFGYTKGGEFRLYCTVNTKAPNPQTLRLRVDQGKESLFETSSKPGLTDFLQWDFSKLHERLLTKHRETFWIRAHHEIESGKEYFRYESVRHTINPSIAQFDQLLSEGIITMDHLIKQEERGRVSEKGPLFKIPKHYIPLLFPNPRDYSLLA
jgi:hypothetical protein